MAAEAGQSFVVFGENGVLVFGRNALQREAGATDCPEVVFNPSDKDRAVTKCSSVEVEGGAPFAVILSRTIKTWGADSGANEKGVTVSVSWSANEKELLATDLARLALERSSSAADAVDVIAQLNEKHGQEYDGPESPKFSLLICDPTETWIMDIAGKLWAAEKFSEGYRRIPASLGVATKFDKSSENLQAKCQEVGVFDGSGELNFRESFASTTSKDDFLWPGGELSDPNSFTLENMFSLLRENTPSVGTKSSQVSVLSSGDKLACHWFTATNNTAESVFKPFVFTENVRISPLTIYDAAKEADVTLLVKYHSARNWERAGDLLKSLETTCVAEVKEALASNPDPAELEELMKDCVEAEVKFYR